MLDTLQALYATVMSIYGFFSAVMGWFGFRALFALMGLFFFYRLFRNFFPNERVFSVIASITIFTTLWITWNHHYKETYDLFGVAKTYLFILVHVLGLLLIQRVIRWVIRHVRLLGKRGKNIQPLELYEEIDHFAGRIKQAVKEKDITTALRHIKEMEQNFSRYNRKPAPEET